MSTLTEAVLTIRSEQVRFGGTGDGLPSTAIYQARVDAKQEGLTPEGAREANTVGVRVTCTPEEVVPSCRYRFYGTWSQHPKYGWQFAAKTFVVTEPHGEMGTRKYLATAPGYGPAIARAMWQRWGASAVQVARENPDVVAEFVDRVTPEVANKAAAHLQERRATEGTTVDLMELIADRGFPVETIRRAIHRWGSRAAKIVRHNPYALLRFPRCGFARVDQLYVDLGHDSTRLKRQAYAIWHLIDRDRSGHTWHPAAELAARLRDFVPMGSRFEDAVRLALRGRLLSARGDYLADYRKAANEGDVAERVTRWLQGDSRWPDLASLDVSEHQRDVLGKALARGRLAIFGGGPGTGKTYAGARVIAAGMKQFGGDKVAVAAPTGKAAVRITEAMQGYGIDTRATTVHSLLKVTDHDEDTGGWGFEHGRSNPLPYSLVVVDEASMLDVDLVAALCRACGRRTHLLLIGDTGQLPPVGHGAPLRDLIAAGVPYGELTEVRRNSGQIVQSCHAVRRGEPPVICESVQPGTAANLYCTNTNNAGDVVSHLLRLHDWAKGHGADPLWDCQVICALNESGPVNRKVLNEALQSALNPSAERLRREGMPKAGDKVVCTSNGLVLAYKGTRKDPTPRDCNTAAIDGKVFVANGEQARVEQVGAKHAIASLAAPKRRIMYPLGGDWELAYAISCHKSQGSEWPFVFVVLDGSYGASMICSREWLYTAMSRAKNICALVGSEHVARAMVGREAIRNRKTLLAERIKNNAN